MIKLLDIYNQILNETLNLDEKEIRCAAWLFMLYRYEGKMEIKSWERDNRMGINFIDAMSILQKKKLVKIDNTTIRYTNITSCVNYLNKIFGKYDNLEDAQDAEEKYKKYNTKDYPISEIPTELFEQQNDDSITADTNGWLSGSFLEKWIRVYERYPEKAFSKKLLDYADDYTLKFKDKDYILYRGLYIRNSGSEKFKNIKIGDKIINKNHSWTTDIRVAEGFAKGSTNWMDSPKLSVGDIGIILKHKFENKDILFDLYYMEKVGYNFIDFSSEKEVIVKPTSGKYEVYKIIKTEKS